MTFTILWSHGRALNVPATGDVPATDSVAAALPYRWRVAWRRRDGWRLAGAALYCVLYDRRNRPIVTLYATPAP